MLIRIISVVLTVFLAASCTSKQTVKEEVQVLPPAEVIKLPELTQKPAEPKEIKRIIEPVRIEKEAEEKYVILNFDGADIETVISTIGELLNLNYILSPGVTGKVTIQSYRKFPVKDLFAIFQTILEINGLTAVKDGTLYRIVPIDTAKQQPIGVEIGKEIKLQLDSSFITQIIPLEYVKANDVVNVMRNLMPKGADLVVYEPTNLIIATAPPAALVKFMKLLEAIDIPATDRESMKTYVYYVEHGDSKKIVEIFKALYPEKKDKKVTAARPTTPAPAQTTKTPSATGAAATASPPPIESLVGEIEGDIIITAYEDINGIVIRASPKSYLAILDTLKRLDVPVKQVLIEVLIAEVSLNDETKLGIEWLLKTSSESLGAGNTVVGGNTAGGISFDTSTSQFSATLPTSGFAYVVDPNRFSSLISAAAIEGNMNVLASPHILAMDNKEAKIEIADEVPVATSVSQPQDTTSNTTSTVEFKSVGTILTVTPHINEKKQVTLKISQEVSELGDTVKIAGQDYQGFKTRKATTSAIVQDGHTLVLGGIITEKIEQSRSGIPILSDIPILGYLFGTTTDKKSKKELVLMVTPHVVSTQDESDAITKTFQNRVKIINEGLEKFKPIEVPGKSSSDVDIIIVKVEADASLIELIEMNGYILKDEDLSVFLNEFTALNEDIRSIKTIPKGSTVKLPLKHLKEKKS